MLIRRRSTTFMITNKNNDSFHNDYYHTSVSCTESKDVTGIWPSLLVSRLDNHFILSGGCQTVKYKVASVSKSIPELWAGSGIINGWNDVGPFNGLFVVKVRRATGLWGRWGRASILIGIVSIIGLQGESKQKRP